MLAASSARAVVLDWSSVVWTPGSLSQSFDIDGNAQNGNDITITLTGNTNKLTTDPSTGLAAPSISTTLEGGTGGDHSLFIGGNLSTQTTFTVTVTFTGQYNAALNVSFSLFDIDNGPDRENIVNIYGLLSDGVTKVAPSVTVQNPGTVSLTGSGLTQTLTGNVASPDTGVNSSNGNATFNFGNTAIGSFSFDFKNDGGAPRFQAFALYDITFKPVPEVNPTISGGVACIFAVLITIRMQRRRRT